MLLGPKTALLKISSSSFFRARDSFNYSVACRESRAVLWIKKSSIEMNPNIHLSNHTKNKKKQNTRPLFLLLSLHSLLCLRLDIKMTIFTMMVSDLRLQVQNMCHRIWETNLRAVVALQVLLLLLHRLLLEVVVVAAAAAGKSWSVNFTLIV